MRSIRLTLVVIASAFATLSSQPIPQGTGAAGAWQKTQKLKTTAACCMGPRIRMTSTAASSGLGGLLRQ